MTDENDAPSPEMEGDELQILFSWWGFGDSDCNDEAKIVFWAVFLFTSNSISLPSFLYIPFGVSL